MQASESRRHPVRCSIYDPEATLSGHAILVHSKPDAGCQEMRVSGARHLLEAVGLQRGDDVVMDIYSDGSLKVWNLQQGW